MAKDPADMAAVHAEPVLATTPAESWRSRMAERVKHLVAQQKHDLARAILTRDKLLCTAAISSGAENTIGKPPTGRAANWHVCATLGWRAPLE